MLVTHRFGLNARSCINIFVISATPTSATPLSKVPRGRVPLKILGGNSITPVRVNRHYTKYNEQLEPNNALLTPGEQPESNNALVTPGEQPESNNALVTPGELLY